MEFFAHNKDQLSQWLYNSNIHDSILVSCCYNICDKSLYVEAWNPIFDEKISFVFRDILYICFEKKDEYEFDRDSWKTIGSLTLEPIESCKEQFGCHISTDASMAVYLVFQFLSGSELHVVSKGCQGDG